MIKILGNSGWHYFDINKIDGLNFDLNKLYLQIYLNGQTVSCYVKDQKDIIDFINTITKDIKKKEEKNDL